MGEIKERIQGKNPSSAMCVANTDIRLMYGRKGAKKVVSFGGGPGWGASIPSHSAATGSILGIPKILKKILMLLSFITGGQWIKNVNGTHLM